jgi:DNA-binding transcriptional ArsR family regulator
MTTGKRLLSKIKPQSKIIEGIAHPYRLAIVHLVAQKPMAEKDVVRRLKIKQSLVAHHILLLRKSGWLRKKMVGSRIVYTLLPKPYQDLLRMFDGTPFGKHLGKIVQ